VLQDQVIKNHKTPIMVFHNDYEFPSIPGIPLSDATHIITCNSFEINPNAYLTTTTFIDMEATIKSINSALTQPTTRGFYNSFIDNYGISIKQINNQQALVWLGRGALISSGIGGGIYTVVYLTSNND
jgi:hypothetical protein